MERPSLSASTAAVVLVGLAGAIGAVIVVGGWADSQGATAWVEGLPSAVPLTGFTVVSVAVGIAGLAVHRPVVAVVAGIVAVVCVLTGVAAHNEWIEVLDLLTLPTELGPEPGGAPAISTAVLLGAISFALLLAAAGRVVAAEAVAAAAAVIAYVSGVAYLFGDGASIIAGSALPQARTSLPTTVAVLFMSVGLVMAVPDLGIWAWLHAFGAGRAILRRVLAPLLLAPVVVVGVVRVLDLHDRLGAPRADAVVATSMALFIFVVAFFAVREIDRLSAEAQLREVAARVAAANAEDARRAHDVADLAARLSAASTLDEVSDALVSDGAASMRATWISLAMLDPIRPVMSVVHGTGGEGRPTVVDDSPEISVDLDRASPMVEALTTKEMVWVHDRGELERRYPHALPQAVASGVHSMVAAPLCRYDGEAIGVLGVGWGDQYAVEESLRSVVSTIATLVAQTLERAQLSDAEHALVAGLQERLVGSAPQLESLDIDVRYEPAATLGMGGDWYEIIEGLDGQVTVVLGDVSGHGVDAVADMARARTLIGALVRQGLPLGNILYQVDELLGGDEAIMATVVLVRIDPRAGLVRHTCAGHPPVAVRHGDGSVELLQGGRQPLLGAGVGLRPIDPPTVEVGPGTVLVIYSDGLIERRGENLDVGFDRLLQKLSDAPVGSAQAVAEHIEREMLGGSGGVDDTAMVVIQIPGAVEGPPGRVRPGPARRDEIRPVAAR